MEHPQDGGQNSAANRWANPLQLQLLQAHENRRHHRHPKSPITLDATMRGWPVHLYLWMGKSRHSSHVPSIHAIFFVYLFGPIPPLYMWALKIVTYICPCHQPPQAGRPCCSRRHHGFSSQPASCWSHRTGPCRGDQRDWGEHKKIKGTGENTNSNHQVYIVKL